MRKLVKALLILPVALYFYFSYLDSCPQHEEEISIKIRAAVTDKLNKDGFFTVSAVTKRQPLFYCISGAKAHYFELNKLATAYKVDVSRNNLYCGFWSSGNRLFMVFPDAMIDIKVPYVIDADDSASVCSEDLDEKFYPTQRSTKN
jgi:hypothetical protein